MKNKGFTLVELSIVLVIIGLLVGGILIAQGLIETVKMQSFIRQLGQYDAAVISFRSRFKSWPGDSNLFSPSGDRDGLVETSGTNAGTDPHLSLKYDYELANFWKHIQLGGFLTEYPEFSSDASAGLRAGVHLPIVPADSEKAGIIYHWNNYVPNSPWYHVANVEGTTSGNQNVGATGAFKAINAIAIDNKIDDGIPRVLDMSLYRGYMWNSNGNNCFVLNAGGTGYEYDISDDEIKCRPIITIGKLTGTNKY